MQAATRAVECRDKDEKAVEQFLGGLLLKQTIDRGRYEMSTMTIAEKIRKKKIKKPNFTYNVLGWVWKTFVAKKYNVHYTYNTDIRAEKGAYIVISNHASRLDYIFTGIPFLPARLNFVAGYNEFFRSHLAFVFDLLCPTLFALTYSSPRERFTASSKNSSKNSSFSLFAALPPRA